MKPAFGSMGTGPLVSVIVTTKNSATFLDRCLASVKAQTYPNVEIIVIDNYSDDSTMEIACAYTSNVHTYGEERSAQFNFGVEKAAGSLIYRVDADFALDPRVVQQCVDRVRTGCDAVVVHNSPDQRAGWIARIRKFEVDMYKYDLTHSASRFFKREVLEAVGGLDERLVAGEDYDIQNRLNRRGFKTGFIDAEAVHMGEPTRLVPHLRKYYAYGRNFVNFRRANPDDASRQLAFARPVYFRQWRRFVAHPLLGLGFVLYHIAKFASGAAGYASARLSRRRHETS